MASFTDQISQFNPYIQETPVQEMVQVGMAKQAKYDQGVQRIQSYIDNVAGIDVLRPVDKEYLQSKLNELGSKLKTVAAGDFSNQQLVNSVGGMAGQIVKDYRIQKDIASTQRAKSELATANSLYKQGKSSLRNVNSLNKKINNYANSIDPDETFTEKYVNYVDLFKKYQDIADNLKKNAPERSVDQPNKTDAKGNTIYYVRDNKGKLISSSIDPSKGSPERDITMKKFTIKGVSSQKLYDAFKASLTGDDLEQMKIDAEDYYKDKSPESIIKDTETNIKLIKQMLEKEVQELKVNLYDNKLSKDEKESIQQNINIYEDKLNNGSLDKILFNKVLELQNPKTLEKSKYDTYFSKTLNDQAIILSNQSYKEELLASPIEAAIHAREVLQETIKNNNIDNALNAAKFEETKKDNRLKNEQWWADFNKKYPK